MSRPLLLRGKPIHDHTILEIIDIATSSSHRRYASEDPRDDHYRNRNLLKAFDGATERTSDELAAAFHLQRPDWSQHFNALRGAECLQWAMEHRIVFRNDQRWTLLATEMQFELVGPEKKQRALRVRGLMGAAAVEANKLWVREQKRRERARLRMIEKFKPVVLQQLDAICRRDPERRIDTIRDLERFVVGDITASPGAAS